LLIDEAPYVDQQVRLMGKGSIMHGLNSSIVKALLLVIPPPEEQRAILDFLHRETDKIDALVTEQQRLIELLKEKLQTVISRGVIKGLTPDAPMTPSGVEWLGDVPTCWKVMPLKWACSLIKDGTHLPPSRVDNGVPLLSVRNIVDGEFVLRDDDSLISRESYDDLCHSFEPRATDVLLAIVGATLGKTAVIPEGFGSFQIQRSLAVFRPSPSVLISKFLHLLFRSRPFQSFLWEQVGFSAQPGIYLGTLQDVRIPVPSVGEQSTIAGHLEQTTREFDGLIIEAKRAIALLQERRTALISAAVTGKIDVRGLVDAAEAA
jgi:type I restriction enzyme S subunit